jgi:hypothetical protein
MEKEKPTVVLELIKPESYDQIATVGRVMGKVLVDVCKVEEVHHRYAVGRSSLVNCSYPDRKDEEYIKNFKKCIIIEGGSLQFYDDYLNLVVEDGEKLYKTSHSRVMYIVKSGWDDLLNVLGRGKRQDYERIQYYVLPTPMSKDTYKTFKDFMGEL